MIVLRYLHEYTREISGMQPRLPLSRRQPPVRFLVIAGVYRQPKIGFE
jgi:hypothetical protein